MGVRKAQPGESNKYEARLGQQNGMRAMVGNSGKAQTQCCGLINDYSRQKVTGATKMATEYGKTREGESVQVSRGQSRIERLRQKAKCQERRR